MINILKSSSGDLIMEMKDVVFESFIAKTENIVQIASNLFAKQQVQLDEIKSSINCNQNELSLELLALASEMNKNKLSSYAGRIESCVVQHLLKAPYDAKRAFATHKALFAERHKMAMFLHENLAEIKQRVHKKIQNNNNTMLADRIKVFTYWDNDDKLPQIVSLCRASLNKHISADQFDLIVLNGESYKNWTDFRKEDIKADITQAHFTDILRVKLLEKWGGFWLDATDMLTCDFYQATTQIRQQNYFMFTYSGSRTGTWFMYSKPRDYIVSMLSESISLWWEKQCYLTNYFMLHDIIEMLYWIDVDYRREWDDMLKVHPQRALSLLQAYNKTLDWKSFENLAQGSFVHKLTYKYDSGKIIKSSVLENILTKQVSKIVTNHNCFDFDIVKNKVFIFSRRDGSNARKMMLDDSGVIKNIDNNGHNNECFWAIERGLLVFKDINNQITGVFYENTQDENKMYIYGYFRTNPKLEFKLMEVEH